MQEPGRNATRRCVGSGAYYHCEADRRPQSQAAETKGGMDKQPQLRVPDSGHYEVASDAGGERAAAIYTLVQSKLNNVNPEAYLRDVLIKIADGHPINKIDALLPWQAEFQNLPTGTPNALTA